MSKTHKGGLLETVINNEQKGGGDSYAWHRSESRKHRGIANARSHLLSKKKLPWETEAKSGESKRTAWISEVREVMVQSGLNWRDALKEASRRRKEKVPNYLTVEERVKDTYTGRKSTSVKCTPGKVCPGKYDKPIATKPTGEVMYRPNAHNVSKRHLTAEAATNLLRDYYRNRAKSGLYKKGISGATKAMRQDIGKTNSSRVMQSPCPTKLITVTRKDGKVYQRRVVDKDHPDFAACRSNWLYRATPRKFDMKGVDAGDSAAGKSKLYNSKGRKNAANSRRLAKISYS